MDFYRRAGAGRYSEDEQMMIDAIKRIIMQKQIPENQIPECHSLDELIELKQYLESYEPTPEAENDLEPWETETEDSEEESIDWEDEPEPLNESEDTNLQPEPESEPEPEPELIAEGNDSDANAFVADNYNPFADEIIERSYNQSGAAAPNPGSDPDDELNLEESKDNPLSDLPPHTKRRAAEQTADTLLKGYAQIAPMPFKWWAKFPEEKIEKMAFNGELDLSLEVSDGISFDDYMKQANAQLDEIFEVDSDTLNDIREPLIEVLMEQNLELTPTQRLLAAVFSHVMQMFTVALKLSKQNNRILSYQKHLTFLMQGQSKMAA